MTKRRVLTFTETVPKRRFKFLPLGEFDRSLLPEAILIAQANIIQYPQEQKILKQVQNDKLQVQNDKL